MVDCVLLVPFSFFLLLYSAGVVEKFHFIEVGDMPFGGIVFIVD